MIHQQGESFGCTAEIRDGVLGFVLTNDPKETRKAAQIARDAFGEDQAVEADLASEDFAFML